MKWHSIKLSATCFRNISNKQIRVIKLQKQLPWNILYVKIINVFKKVSGKFTEERYRGVIKHNYLNAISRSESLNHWLLEQANEEASFLPLSWSYAFFLADQFKG